MMATVSIVLSACEWCGNQFIPKQGKRFCASKCQKHASNSKRPKREPDMVSCEVCGSNFKRKRSNNVICSKACHDKKWYLAHLRDARARVRDWYRENTERRASYTRDYYAENRESVRAQVAGYRAENLEYLRSASKNARLAYSEATAQFRTDRRRNWSPSDDALIMDERTTNLEKAFMLRRTYSSVIGRRTVLRKKGLIA